MTEYGDVELHSYVGANMLKELYLSHENPSSIISVYQAFNKIIQNYKNIFFYSRLRHLTIIYLCIRSVEMSRVKRKKNCFF